MDLLVLAIVTLLFISAAAYVAGCDRLKGTRS
jgi:hypothetical protein